MSHFSAKKLERLAHCKQVMQQIASEICLIRDKSLLNLPPKTEEYVKLIFSQNEQTFYDSLQIYALSRVERLEQAIQDKQFEECARDMGSNVLKLIHRLKLATTNCMFVLDCMPRLKGVRTLGEATGVLEYFNKSINRKEECAVCLDQDANHISVCGHKLCKSCWDKTLAKQKMCPFCRHPVSSVKSVESVKSVSEEEKDRKKQKDVLNFGLIQKSTKLLKLIDLLENHIGTNNENVVIVSQSILTLDYIQEHVDAIYPGKSVRIVGSCSLEDRNQSIESFQKDENIKIMYYSLTCNPEGITLTRGTVLIHMDQWWNKTGKVSQVNDRIHRISQTKPTKIYYLCVERTIETNIFKLHTRKENIINYQFEGQETRPHILNHDFENEGEDE
jgi:SNF2 family DNA or RNA helicase